MDIYHIHNYVHNINVDLDMFGSVDMGCPSVCCDYVLLPLVNKEAYLVSSQK